MIPVAWQDRLALALVAIGAGTLIVVQIWRVLDPVSLWPRLEEYSAIENGQFGAMLLVFPLGLGAARDAYRRRRPWLPWFGLALFGFLIAGEEVTWGRDLIHYPAILILGVSVDTLHDFPDVLAAAADLWLVAANPMAQIGVGAAAGWSVVTLASIAVRHWRALLTTLRFGPRPERFIAVALIVGILSQIVDNRILWPTLNELTRRSFEEPLELISALSWLCVALSYHRGDPAGQ